ncbi:hypothetical protein OG21DRAFT_1493288 [Imleria badia]|nr:hypothetical protein OG21DRAFT_1493288 [Imleria badia]
MPSYSALALAFALVSAVRALPVDEISARTDIGSATSGVGGQAGGGSVSAAGSSCTSPPAGCAISELLYPSLLKVDSENAGDGGDAFSGVSKGITLPSLIGTNSTSQVPEGSGLSGDGGEAPGGSVVDNHPAFIELDSDDAGRGGDASSGSSSGLVN